jgi:hypothetical protein
MEKRMYNIDEAIQEINSGKSLIIAADERILSKLPVGNWIGGTIPYFIGENGGLFSQDKLYITEIPDYAISAEIKIYDAASISTIYTDAKPNGFSFLLIPCFSDVHLSFALKAPSFDNFAVRPLTGWVAGYDLNEAQATAKVFDGRTGKAMPANAIAFHVGLPSNKIVDMQIVNIFSQGSGDLIKFPNDGFTVITAFVNGKEVNFADYIIDNKIDIQYPMVADMYGAMINTSFKTIDSENKIVHLFAPVFKDIEYRVGAYIEDYVTEFLSNLPIGVDEKMFFSCNCILNYLYANLESKKTGNATGPVTFGEIAYQLLNQTMTLLTIEDA